MPHKEERKFSCICCGYLTCYEEGVGSTAYWQHKGAHALLGCAVGAAKAGDWQSGAFGGVVGEIVAEELANTSLGNNLVSPDAKKRANAKKTISTISQITSLFSASEAGLDFKTAQQTAKNAVENNALRIRKKIKNRKVLEKLQELHEKIKEEYKDRTGKELSDDDFWIEVTGGDRYTDEGDEFSRSRSDKDGEKIKILNKKTGKYDPVKPGPHDENNGARGVDFKFSANIPKELIVDILRNDPDIGHPNNVIDTYNDHVHFNLRSDNKENYLSYKDKNGNTISNSVGNQGWRDYEINPDSRVFEGNKNGIPSYFNFNPNKPLLEGTKTFPPYTKSNYEYSPYSPIPFNNKNKIDIPIETNKPDSQNIIDFFSTDNFIEKFNNEILNLHNK